jgi:SAM-dependent methyltransferase
MDFKNVYDDKLRAESYAQLEFPGTYYLAYRDIPAIIEKYTPPLTTGTKLKALDFGCGTGRSTRFLKNLGFDAIGVDISEDMLAIARRLDPEGEYILTSDQVGRTFLSDDDSQNLTGRNACPTELQGFDLITAVFTFDNIPGIDYRTSLLKQLGGSLNDNGIILMVNSTPEIYVNEWLSFSTKDFPENKKAKGGDKVKIIMTDVEDKRPVEDIVWFDNDYRDLFSVAGLKLIETLKPLGKTSELYAWVNETTIAPWVIYILRK